MKDSAFSIENNEGTQSAWERKWRHVYVQCIIIYGNLTFEFNSIIQEFSSAACSNEEINNPL